MNLFLFYIVQHDYIFNTEESSVGSVSKSVTKLVLWLQKHYILSKFKPNDTFL